MKKIKGIIDRIEGEYAVVEIGNETRDILRSILPKNVQTGDVVYFQGDEVLVDKEQTEKRRKEIEDLMDEIWED
ncbi:DUF3006 domain-containing protein [Fictibacillus enclensis]|uniref:Pyruvate kinase n=1 Tax=Fictibacillus enclensis TaxID=1017270 RepID=A0A0V8JA69_9BACL|nr:DUF3006 domain-containing protein [Fictibacillus enclensis]KSU83867.1 pyruvate kinase [Fictibacillus enclensis]MDM5199842.1 DUF3006 domain-containing protein [Fictibacillus enclensis]MDM5339130.1 DUF3006 domain-containing protein [Fictibacillus enclensis]WHY70610.1 DUF3006 domain-containing protein [Fictibacillus enclensis]SCC22298.1 Protein of unknown function [Fictibacillus enclensis]